MADSGLDLIVRIWTMIGGSTAVTLSFVRPLSVTSWAAYHIDGQNASRFKSISLLQRAAESVAIICAAEDGS